jgi:hypothetical protein
VTCSNSELFSEITNHFDSWWDSLDGGSYRRKACICTGQHNTERQRQTCLKSLFESFGIILLSKKRKVSVTVVTFRNQKRTKDWRGILDT